MYFTAIMLASCHIENEQKKRVWSLIRNEKNCARMAHYMCDKEVYAKTAFLHQSWQNNTDWRSQEKDMATNVSSLAFIKHSTCVFFLKDQ